ncbi:MAG: hypothetical protein A3B44_03300 [Candidatus Levybacteria bacterium RIFCSPLOWO2_01_FULL_38_21]|nr:MAG: hypothetical protein A3B44_03300 [Candidatus Levybacteria bacterium RIFCSPLOWO2_01_FULL_38_21]
MIGYARIYYIYQSLIVFIIRIFLFIFLFFYILLSIFNNSLNLSLIKTPLFLLSLFLIIETFFHFKISRKLPEIEVQLNKGDPLDSFTLRSLSIFLSSNNTQSLIRKLLKIPSINFLLDKMDILSQEEIKLIDIPREELIRYAFEISKNLKGKFVTTMDLFVSYLLLTEDKTKVIFNKNLKKEELIQILSWARTRFTDEENPKSFRVSFWGEGIGEGWVTGWTIETKKYMVDLTGEVLQKKPSFLGRESEIRQLVEGMYKGKSTLLVGETGSGKTELAESLAFESFIGNLRGSLYHQRFYMLLVDALLSGSDNLGQLEERLDSVIAELSHCGNIIVFLPSFENILGSSSFHLDLSGILIPYIQRGAIRIIATITPGSFKKFVETRKTLLENLEIIKVDEPSEETSLTMLFKKASEIERSDNIKISYRAIDASLKYAKKYLPDRVLPGSSITLLEDAAASAVLSKKQIVEEQDVIQKIESKTKIAVGKPGKKEKELLLNLEDEIHKRVVDQREAVSEVSEAMRRLRTGLTIKDKPISFLFLGPTGVGKTETAKTLAKIYFGNAHKMIRLDMSEYSEEGSLKRLLGSMPGEEEMPGELTDKILDSPFSLVLLDEFEKASSNILNLFLQILDDGRLTDNKGKTVSFTNAIIIATSNAASEFIREEVNKGTAIDKKFQEQLLEFLQTKGILKPELLNRFDGIIVFKPLGQEEIQQVTKILLKELSDRMLEQDITVSFDKTAIEKIIREGFDEEFGARPINRYIQDNIEDLLAQKILKDEIKRGDKLLITVNNSQITISAI